VMDSGSHSREAVDYRSKELIRSRRREAADPGLDHQRVAGATGCQRPDHKCYISPSTVGGAAIQRRATPRAVAPTVMHSGRHGRQAVDHRAENKLIRRRPQPAAPGPPDAFPLINQSRRA